jgi:hypothetical protein
LFQITSWTSCAAPFLNFPLLAVLLFPSRMQLEKAQKDPARVQLLYERALAVFSVTSELWLQYTRYLEAELKVPSLINKVSSWLGLSRWLGLHALCCCVFSLLLLAGTCSCGAQLPLGCDLAACRH